MSLNSVTLVGHLGADPELRTTSGGKQVCTLRVATDRAKSEETDWHEVSVWDQQGERCHEHLRKGSLVGVQGRLQYRTWDGDDGKTRKAASVVAYRIQFLGSKASSDTADRARQFSVSAVPDSPPSGEALPF